MKGIYQFYCDFGRMGELEGIFIADSKEVESTIGNTVYFGEVLGKHSDIDLDIEEEHFELKTEDQEFIEKFEEIMGSGNISGFNPIMLYQEQLEEDSD